MKKSTYIFEESICNYLYAVEVVFTSTINNIHVLLRDSENSVHNSDCGCMLQLGLSSWCLVLSAQMAAEPVADAFHISVHQMQN